MQDTTVLVVGSAADESLHLLAESGDGVRFVVGSRPEDFGSAVLDAEAVFFSGGHPPALDSILAVSPRVRWVHARWAGLEGLLSGAIAAHPAVLTNARGVYSGALAEFVLGAILYFAKDMARMVRNQRAGRWEPFDVEEIRSKTLGIVGYGHIGASIAERCRGCGLRVLALRRNHAPVADPRVDEWVPTTRLGDLMARSDYVAVALPATAETFRMVDAAAIEALKPSAVFVNVGRGSTVDEDALVRSLKQGRIRGVALDVFETEPLPAGHPLYHLENVLVSPHCADHTPTWRHDAVRLFLENLARFRRGEALQNVVDKARGY
ncbi:MAG: D-2-hydroxyacid dehydrogenase [Vicinamibacteria bacterium]